MGTTQLLIQRKRNQNFFRCHVDDCYNPWASKSGFDGYSRPRSTGIRRKSSSEYAGMNHNCLSIPNTCSKFLFQPRSYRDLGVDLFSYASIVVVLAATKEMCIIRKPHTLNAKARFNTKARKVVATMPGVPGISPSLKNATKYGNNDKVTRLVSKNV